MVSRRHGWAAHYTPAMRTRACTWRARAKVRLASSGGRRLSSTSRALASAVFCSAVAVASCVSRVDFSKAHATRGEVARSQRRPALFLVRRGERAGGRDMARDAGTRRRGRRLRDHHPRNPRAQRFFLLGGRASSVPQPRRTLAQRRHDRAVGKFHRSRRSFITQPAPPWRTAAARPRLQTSLPMSPCCGPVRPRRVRLCTLPCWRHYVMRNRAGPWRTTRPNLRRFLPNWPGY